MLQQGFFKRKTPEIPLNLLISSTLTIFKKACNMKKNRVFLKKENAAIARQTSPEIVSILSPIIQKSIVLKVQKLLKCHILNKISLIFFS